MKSLFEIDHNWDVFKFLHHDELRDIEIKEVEKMLKCNDISSGYFLYHCPECGEIKCVGYGCRSRLCSNCGKYYTDKWAENISNAMLDVPHRHIVLGIPPQLWDLLSFYGCSLWKVLMDSAIECLNSVLSHKHHKKIRVGAIIVLHPFSKDLSSKHHLHLLITEGGFYKNEWIHDYYFPEYAMRKTWQYQILTNLKKNLPQTKEYSILINSLFKKYDGFYVYLPEKSRIVSKRDIAKYIGRYVRHPAIANSRISGYDGNDVYYWYKDNEDNRHNCSLPKMEFIRRLLNHLPDKQYKMIRYYGAYSRGIKKKFGRIVGQRSIEQSKIDNFDRSRKVYCHKCNHLMDFVEYFKKGPPTVEEFGTKIDHWKYIGIAKAI